ncbi:site-specific integrase [Vagococcus carniphilus]|uniref:tyrosine-type recombinase/integrase n=1 Tax=Vagococcus carniphilus TaxID=218144 RepID=UPI00288F6EBB|nr:site-specific integrase [Vagococcus carniphilus]MDT2848791.1 site-specific integrase [Vagococcus carniphilus]
MNAIDLADKNKLNEPLDLSEVETFVEWFRYWYLSFRVQNIRQVTKQKYSMIYNHLFNSNLGQKQIKEIKRIDVQNYVNEFGATRSKQTVFDHMQFIRSSLNDALTEGVIVVNPASNIRMTFKEQNYTPMEQKKLREEKKWLEIDEYQKLKYYMLFKLEDLLHTYDPPGKKRHSKATYYVMIFIGLKTGARLSEVLGLTRDDINFETNEISIDKTWDYKFKTGFAPTKNYSSIRTIPLDKETCEILKKYIEWLDLSSKKMESNALFVLKNTPLYVSTVNSFLKRLLLEVDIPVITFHKLRHTHASYLIANKVPLQVVAKRLGHTDTNMVSQVYGHLLKETEDSGNRRILELL